MFSYLVILVLLGRIRDIIQEDDKKGKKIYRKFYINKNGVNLAKCTKNCWREYFRIMYGIFILSL